MNTPHINHLFGLLANTAGPDSKINDKTLEDLAQTEHPKNQLARAFYHKDHKKLATYKTKGLVDEWLWDIMAFYALEDK